MASPSVREILDLEGNVVGYEQVNDPVADEIDQTLYPPGVWVPGSDLPSGTELSETDKTLYPPENKPSVTDPSFLSTIAKALGTTEADLLKMGLGGLFGGLGGYALSKQPQGTPARGVQQFTRKADTQRPTGAIGTGAGGGGISYFSSPNSQPSEFKFDPSYYLTANPDVNAYVRANLGQFGGDPNRGAYEHFMKFGMGEQRRPSATGALTPFGGLTTTARERPIPLGERYAAGGQTPSGLGYLRSAEDGMADRIPATIDNRQPAKLSGGEFVIPADVVSHLGNGNSDAGAKQLHDFMARIRKARTGNQAQGKRIDPAKFFPKGRG